MTLSTTTMNTKACIGFLGLLLVASAAAAQTAQAAPTIEVTPFVGFQFGGWFSDDFGYNSGLDDVDIEESESWGLILEFAVNRHAQIELLYSRQETELRPQRFPGPATVADLDVEYFQVGFLWQWTPGQFRPFVAGSLGAASFDPEHGDSETRFATTVGGGVKLLVNEHFGVRFEGRVYSTLLEDDDELFCGGRCHYHRDSSVLVQLDLKAGLVFRF